MVAALAQGTRAQSEWPIEVVADPAEAQFIATDLHNFVRAYARLDGEADTLAVLQEEYFDRGSPGLRAFAGRYQLTPESMRAAIRKKPDRYAALAASAEVLQSEAPAYRQAYARLKQHIPGAVFPPTYFLVGDYRGIGTGSEVGPLVTVETRNEAQLRGDFAALIVHEMVHMQQAMTIGPEKYQAIYGPEKSVLAHMVREGIAEYFADLVTGHMTQEKARPYVEAHERELWEQFTPVMLGSEDSGWMWAAPEDPARPRGVGYVMGALITRAYYDNADDKARAVQDILSVTDYPTFLEKSGYTPQ
jgi:hypothetical protein